jgi:hypothetical protein
MDDRDADFAEYAGERSAALRRYAYLLTETSHPLTTSCRMRW